jgi:hypothetical protein
MSGYPVVEPDHPLYAAQQDGWPDHTPFAAMREVVRLAQPFRVNSLSHPAFGEGYIVNDQAERERQASALPPERARERR